MIMAQGTSPLSRMALMRSSPLRRVTALVSTSVSRWPTSVSRLASSRARFSMLNRVSMMPMDSATKVFSRFITRTSGAQYIMFTTA